MEREMINMIVDTLLVFYYKKSVGYMPSSFANLVFAGERIEVGLKRGKFDYVAPASTSNRRSGPTRAKRKEGDAQALTSALAWPKPQSTPHNTHQYVQHHPSFLACIGNSSNSAPVQQRTPTTPQRAPAQAPAPARPLPTGDFNPGTSSNLGRNPLMKKLPKFAPILMSYGDLLPSLIANQLVVVTPRRITSLLSRDGTTPTRPVRIMGGTPGHSIEQYVSLEHKVQSLIDAGWLIFQEDGLNVKTNPLANHGGPVVNAIEACGLQRPKQIKDVVTPRRFIFGALQEVGIVSFDGHKGDSCLMHPGTSHDMETCSTTEELLQQMMDQCRFEISKGNKGEQHVYMQSTDKESPARPKPLVIHFTMDVATQKPRGLRPDSGSKLVSFPYRSNKVVPWRYTPQKPSEKKEEATGTDLPSAKVTNITDLSAPDPSVQPTNTKGKAKVVAEETNEASPTLDEDVLARRFAEKGGDFDEKKVSMEEANEFLRIIQQSEFKVIKQLNKTPARVSLLELLMNSEPHQVLLVKVLNEAHMAQDIFVEGFEGIISNITANNYLTFTEEEIPVEGLGHNMVLHVSVKCMDHIVAKADLHDSTGF
ncbi:uncharacterized protein [Glycine max]|uniref:uncharacterized protein n=1 Tax=Glycine max TaxID=3847 RepID=UPI000E21BB53|nr:uncharacterized protein LOC106796164 [Glycine max]|eukprot:XP_025981721.1 uncharacterized protein LOC106796164 [Glycine max]